MVTEWVVVRNIFGLTYKCASFELQAIIRKIPGEKSTSTGNYGYRFCANFECRANTATRTDRATGIPYRKFSL